MATLIEKQNIEKARELLDRKDFISAEEILNGLIKTRRFNDHKEVQALLVKAKKLSRLPVPVVIIEPPSEATVDKEKTTKNVGLLPWPKRVWRKFF